MVKIRVTLSLTTILFVVSCTPASFDNVKPALDTSLSPRTPSLTYSSIDFVGPSIADGVSPTFVTVKLMDQQNKPIVGALLQLQVSGSQNVIMTLSSTNQHGLAYGKIFSTFAEYKTVTAIGEINLSKQIYFGPTPPVHSLISITSSGSVQRALTGQKFITILGNPYAPAAVMDSNGTRRVLPSILGGLADR